MTTGLVERYQPFAEGIAALFHPHVEVVIHDLGTQTVAYLANNISKRSIGDDSALDEIEFDPAETLFGPYQKTNWDGSTIRSVSIVARDDDGVAIGMVCINMDLSVFEAVRAALGSLLDNKRASPQPDKLFQDDWQERINKFLHSWLSNRGLTLTSLSRHEKRDLIEALFAEGAFNGRSSAPYVAAVLGLSRATVFNQLKALRNKTADRDLELASRGREALAG